MTFEFIYLTDHGSLHLPDSLHPSLSSPLISLNCLLTSLLPVLPAHPISLSICPPHLSIFPSFPLTPFTCISTSFFFFYPNLLYPIILQHVKSFPSYPSFPPICHTSTSSLLNHSTFVCFVARVSARRR